MKSSDALSSSDHFTQRLLSIDAVRGLSILLMLLDHVRETFYLHRQVTDPMNVDSTEPTLFFSRLLAHLCAPAFVLLTGLSAYLYGATKGGRCVVAAFLFKRGLFLIVLEFTLVNFSWTFQFPPEVIYMQVIWAIGVSMISLAALVWLPRPLLFILGAAIISGHNLLDGLHFPASSAIYAPWAILHDRGWITLFENFNLRTSYPVLPWIGVIFLGYCLGPWFVRPSNLMQRRRRLLCMGTGSLTGFFTLRLINTYGDASWVVHGDVVRTLMSFFNITKYPPSLLFLMLTLGLVLLLLLTFERLQHTKWIGILAIFGAAPMFFYLLHLYVLKLLYLGGSIVFGLNQGKYFGFDNVGSVWLTAMLLAAVLFVPVHWFAMFKARRRDIVFLKYF